jgi:hypothetical protein
VLAADLSIHSDAPDTPVAKVTLYGAGLSEEDCGYSIFPSVQVFGANGGQDAISVTALSGCSWTATTNDNWISITSGDSGSGNGTVNDSVGANMAGLRTGGVSIAGQTVTVTQSGTTCAYVVNPGSMTFSAEGGTGSAAVITQTGCSWTAAGTPAWVAITSGSTGSGSGTVTFTVSENIGGSRTGSFAIAGKAFNVRQSGVIDPQCGNLPVRIAGGSPQYYSMLQDAYYAAGSGDTVQAQALDFVEDLILNRSVPVTIRGGYNCDYSTNGQNSAIDGTLTIRGGTVTIDHLILQ